MKNPINVRSYLFPSTLCLSFTVAFIGTNNGIFSCCTILHNMLYNQHNMLYNHVVQTIHLTQKKERKEKKSN